MTAGLARAFGPSVRVNAIMPGPFLTDISRAWDMDAFEHRASTEIPLRRGGEPQEIVGAALRKLRARGVVACQAGPGGRGLWGLASR